MGLLSAIRKFVATKWRRRCVRSEASSSKKYANLELPSNKPQMSDTLSIEGPHSTSEAGWTGISDDVLASVIYSDSEDLSENLGKFGGDVEPNSYSSELEVLEALWPEMALSEGSQSSTVVSPQSTHAARPTGRPTPTQGTRSSPITRGMPLSAYLSYPQNVFSDCFAIMLRNVRNGRCTKRNFDTLLRLIKTGGLDNLSALEVLIGSAIMHLLISRMADETFKTTGPYEEAFEAVLQLVDNADVLEWCVQPDFLEVVEWMLRKGTMQAKENALTFLLEISSNDREKFESTVVTHSQGLVDGIVTVIRTRSLLHLLNPALTTTLSMCLSPNVHDIAAKAGLVGALIEILPLRNPEHEEFMDVIAENCLSILKILSTSSAGLQSMREHSSLVPLMIDIMLEFSDSATDSAVEIFRNMCACAPTATRAPALVIVLRDEGSHS